MSNYLGDLAEDQALYFKFHTVATTGAPTQLAGTPVISVFKDDATGTEKTSAESYITLTVDFDGRTGSNHVTIDTSGDAFFATGADYEVVITAGTVDSVSVVGYSLGTFSIENRSLDRTMAELAVGAPTATPTLYTSQMQMYMMSVQKMTATAALAQLHNAAGTVIQDAVLADDDTTFTRSKYLSG